MIKSLVEIEFSSSSGAKNALGALKAEMLTRERSKTTLKVEGKTLVVHTEAADVVALRASLNTMLRLLSVVKSGLQEGI